jgi:hypothetical protein
MVEVDIHVTDADHGSYLIGSVNAPIDEPGDKSVDQVIEEWWQEWREWRLEQEVETDAYFATWLIENKGCEEIPSRLSVYLED